VRALAIGFAVAPVLASVSFGGRAAGPEGAPAAFERGVSAYRAGDYAAAEVYFREALDSPLPPGERARVLYDLGNVAFRLERVTESVGWYEAARRLAPRDADVWENLELARRKAGFEPADRGDLNATLERLARLPTAGESEAIAWAGLGLVALCLLGEALRGGAAWRRAAAVVAVAAGVAAAPWVLHVRARGSDVVLVIAADGAPLRSEPRAELAPIGRVEAGSEVERVDELPGWVCVASAGGRRAWVEEASVFALRR
jgi:tetratricopeptide (TPR) repeat protein